MAEDWFNPEDFVREEFDPKRFEGLTPGQRMELLFKLSREAFARQAFEAGKKVRSNPPRHELPVTKFYIKP